MSKYTVCGYDMDVLHARQLEIAVEVDRICREHGWKCSLYGGSVIGAVRHNGFIPWDHDIDMCMPRKDYDCFVNYMLEHPQEKIFFSNYKSEKRYPNSWGKVRLKGTVFLEKELASLTELHKGVFIDLHPIDNVTKATIKLQVRLAITWSNAGKAKSGIYTGSKGKAAVYKLVSWLPYRVINFFRELSMAAWKSVKTTYVYKVAHPNYGLYPIKREIFEDLIEHEFEGHMFYIPRDYDEFLTKRYGDYMQLPPESEIYECCTTIVECQL